MPRREAPIYQRGKYRLAWDRKANGNLRSPYLAVFWHDPDIGRVRSASTRTAEVQQGMIALDRLWLADSGEASAYCHACGQPIARASAYLLNDAIADYRLEVGDERASADSIAARLKHVVDFLEAEKLLGASCADACGQSFAERFRRWSAKRPVVWRNGDGIVTVSRPRAPATTEESLVQLVAVLNHASDEKRSDARPQFKPLSRKRVSRPRRLRCDIAVLADMLAYAAEPKKRRGSLHAFLVGSICTIARPNTVVDISTAPERRQWWPGAPMIDLNPAGRTTTSKGRSIIPVLPPLEAWLRATAEDPKTGGWLVNYYGRPVLDVETSWRSMLTALGLPQEREWRPYLLRHSVSTLVRSGGGLKWELQAWLGHAASDPTESYAVATEFPTVSRALTDILSAIEERAPGVFYRTITGASSNVVQLRSAQMPG